MLICAAGDIHGAMNRLYQDVLAFEISLGVRFDYVLHVGDFGIWPDPSRIDKATRHHDGVVDFPEWLREKRGAPRPTVFIKGNHEDFVWLDTRAEAEVLPGLTYLRNGCTVDLQDQGAGVIRVGGAVWSASQLPNGIVRWAATIRYLQFTRTLIKWAEACLRHDERTEVQR